MNLLDPYIFFFELPLYTKVDIDKSNLEDFMDLMATTDKVDAYNPSLKQETSFSIVRHPKGSVVRPVLSSYEGFTSFQIQCVRNGFNITYYCFLDFSYNDDDEKENYRFMKIGQYPSIADLHISKIKDYDNILSKDKLREFTKAIGLAANGVGIGSFVYLRRIFEYLIEDAHKSAINDAEWDEELYKKNRTVEKIDQLRLHLPEFLVENKNLYAILSKGIHELDENECLAYFDAVKMGIELILDEKIEVYNKKKKIEDAKKRIQNIGQQLTKK